MLGGGEAGEAVEGVVCIWASDVRLRASSSVRLRALEDASTVEWEVASVGGCEHWWREGVSIIECEMRYYEVTSVIECEFASIGTSR